jgi:heptosyltransferase-2/heptosyltransferase-3
MKSKLFDLLSRLMLPLYKLSGGIEKPNPEAPFKILVIKPDHLGDVILTTPAIALLKKMWPESIIWFLGKEWLLPILEGNPHLDKLVPFNPQWGAHSPKESMSISSISKMARLIRREKFNLSISFQEAPANHLFALLCGIPQRTGYAPRGGKHLLTHCLKGPDETEHAMTSHLKLVESLKPIAPNTASVPDSPPAPSIFLSRNDMEESRKLLLNRCQINGDFIAFHIGAGNPGKEISIEKAIEIASEVSDSVCDKNNMKLLLIGGPGEEERLAEIFKGLQGKTPSTMERGAEPSDKISSISSLNVRELASFLGGSKIFIGHDSGPSHVAAAMGVPVITMWGPGNPDRWAPIGQNTVVVRHQVCEKPPVRPICPDCKCLNAISGTEIAKLCLTMLQKT